MMRGGRQYEYSTESRTGKGHGAFTESDRVKEILSSENRDIFT
ncbi:protein of unknown function [Xenorhabdus nematophila AN6/1]|nr:protein of unknown function [Xenorhabdus nematophila AN6/1]